MRCDGPLGALVQPIDRAHLLLGQLEIVDIGILRLVRVGFRQGGEPVQRKKAIQDGDIRPRSSTLFRGVTSTRRLTLFEDST
jgi:hypothetical protein